MGGVGSGVGSGGPRPGGGRPVGARNKKARKLVEDAERDGLLLPLDYALSVLRDPQSSADDKKWATNTAISFCHARLSVTRTMLDPDRMTDAELAYAVERAERQLAEIPGNNSDDPEDKLDQLLQDTVQLPVKRQQQLLHRLDKVADAVRRRVQDRQNGLGAVPPRPSKTANGATDPAQTAERIYTYERDPVIGKPGRVS